jgi:hypothetical protein
MHEIYGGSDASICGLYQSILKANGIPSYIRNENAALLTELQGPAFYPVLCVDSIEDYESAMVLLQPIYESAKTPITSAEWTCHCGAVVPGNFDTCWQCGAEKDISATPL